MYYDFPAPEKLAAVEGLEGRLREMGFGYRAGYIARTSAMVVQEREAGWLEGLRKVPYKQAKEELVKLQGVGPKVADCVCLMSLDKMEAVPVDTHGLFCPPEREASADDENIVLQIAQNNYGFGKTKNKTLTKATYDAIGDHFRELWGKEAGWAHSVGYCHPNRDGWLTDIGQVLFTAELRSFAEVKGEVKNEVKSEESGGDDKKVTVKAVKRTRTVKVKKEPKVKKEAQVKQEVQVKKEENEDNESSTVTEKRKVKIEEVDVKDDEMLMSLADRVKRRRRG